MAQASADVSTGEAPVDRSVSANGLALHFLDWGGPSRTHAIALHGFALDCHSFDEVAPRLRPRVRLLAFDQRGHGLSDRAARVEDYSRENMVADVEAAVRALGVNRPVVIGHSMGGMNAMTFAARNPERVRALVLVDVGPEVSVDGAREVGAFVAGPYELDSLDAWVEHTHRYYPWRSKERIRARLEVSLRRTPEGKLAKQYDERFRNGFGGVAEARDSLAEVAAQLRCPTLLVHGAKSPVLTREMAERFAARVPCVELVSIEGAGHSVAGDKPDEFVQVVDAFLGKVLARG
jgi:pimeloyl-ACP methyl ester carboxylesterase